MLSPHPPEVVTLSGYQEGESPGGNDSSPLSSTPNSPRGSPTPSENVVGIDASFEESQGHWKETPVRKPTEAPFDEGSNLKSDDEKKVDDGDELMGCQPEKALAPHDEEPPSLVMANSWTASNNVSTVHSTADATVELLVTTPGSHRTTVEDADPEDKFEDRRKTGHTVVALTPVDLKSPPKVQKRSMAWDVNTTPIDVDDPQATNYISPSPGTSEPEQATTLDTEENAPGDERMETETPKVLRPMVSPDGKLEFRTPEQDVEENDIEEHSADDRNVSYKPSFEELEQKNTIAPFHPQGAVGVENKPDIVKPKPVTSLALSTREDLSSDVFLEFASTLSNTVDLAATGASDAVAMMGGLIAGADNVTYGADSSPRHERIASQSSVLSHTSIGQTVSDMIKSSYSTNASISNDWNKYLPQTETDEKEIGDAEKHRKDLLGKKTIRDMTPKKDLKTSEKSAAWLEEEFKRRTNMKSEINKAIVSHHDEKVDEGSQPLDNSFARDLSRALEALPSNLNMSPHPVVRTDTSMQSVDDEVAAITTVTNSQFVKGAEVSSRNGRIPTTLKDTPQPRRLEYGSTDDEDIPRIPVVPSATGWQKPARDQSAKVLASAASTIVNQKTHANPSKNIDNSLQQEMRHFASSTRAALRGREEGSLSKVTDAAAMTTSPFRSLAFPATLRASRSVAQENVDRSVARSESETPFSDSTGVVDISVVPVLVQSMDSPFGIFKGDISLSLLNDNNVGGVETSTTATWANRVKDAIWRCRRMRRSMGGLPTPRMDLMKRGPALGRKSLPVDMDKARVVGGVRSVEAIQEVALGHLKHDEIEEALDLFEDIIFAYYSFFGKVLKEREENPGLQLGEMPDLKECIGAALHNIGILNLLKGEYGQALDHFKRALDNRKSCFGEGHPDHVASLVKVATCHYALNEFAEAHSKLEEALVFARKSATALEDRMQMAEILNNLGCLAYMCGQPAAASTFYRESLDVQFGILGQSLYVTSKFISNAISLNISVTRANIGFVKLVTKESSVAVTALENALMEQQMLLAGANPTLLATMDHLAVSNLLNGDHMKAELMFGRILDLQQLEYGPHDRRCFVTAGKIEMVKSKGTDFEHAIEELRKTLSLPQVSPKASQPSVKSTKPLSGTPKDQSVPKGKNKVMKVLNSIRKKKPSR